MTKDEILKQFPNDLRTELAAVVKEECIDEWLIAPNRIFGGKSPGEHFLEQQGRIDKMLAIIHDLKSGNSC